MDVKVRITGLGILVPPVEGAATTDDLAAFALFLKGGEGQIPVHAPFLAVRLTDIANVDPAGAFSASVVLPGDSGHIVAIPLDGASVSMGGLTGGVKVKGKPPSQERIPLPDKAFSNWEDIRVIPSLTQLYGAKVPNGHLTGALPPYVTARLRLSGGKLRAKRPAQKFRRAWTFYETGPNRNQTQQQMVSDMIAFEYEENDFPRIKIEKADQEVSLYLRQREEDVQVSVYSLPQWDGRIPGGISEWTDFRAYTEFLGVPTVPEPTSDDLAYSVTDTWCPSVRAGRQ